MFLRTAIVVVIAFCSAFPAVAAVKDLPREGFDFFEKNIRPVLVEKCYKCHSLKSDKIKGDLLLDSRAGMLKGGTLGPVLVPFKPDASVLLKALRYQDEDLQMPPKKKLSDFEIKNFEIWIKLGAPDPRKEAADEKTYAKWNIEESKKEFWSFKPVTSPAPPPVKDARWPRNDVDLFLLAKMEEKHVAPVADADKRTLLRRATYDLTGLPPTLAEIKVFLEDKSPNAFEKVVDRLLASPAYGEQWGRHWLDVVRYADTAGCNSDFPIPAAYKYRNYVINAFNHDMPFDDFLREQIAGDLLPSKTDEDRFQKIIATGYLAISRRFGSRNNEFHLTIEDTINNLGAGLLALSTGCARCHDHKFDPIPQKDYYALYGIFSSTKYAFPGTEIYRHPKDFVPLTSGAEKETVIQYQAELAKLDDAQEEWGEKKRGLEARIDENENDAAKASTPEEKKKLAEEKKDFERQLEEIKNALEDSKERQHQLEKNPPAVEKAYAVSEGKIANARIQKRGMPSEPGDEVPRGFLQILGGQTLPKEENGSGRLELANWIASTNNPLTARVMVNRIWQWHFGKGIVQTPNDFGARGKAPTHPELLDALTSRFMQSGWSVKAMHKLIMLSHAYQLSTDNDSKDSIEDVENNYLWRFNRQRLSAEEIRDSMLAIGETLDPSMGGAHPFPPESEWKFSQHKPFYGSYETNRRSVYLMQQRIRKDSLLEVWDGADPNASTGLRPLTTTPIQALHLMNSQFVEEAADKLAARVSKATVEDKKRVDRAFQLVYGRPASREEISASLGYLQEVRSALKQAGATSHKNQDAFASLAKVLFSSSEFLFVE